MLNNFEQTLLDGWEDVYKKGQLTLWILLALKDGPKHMVSIKEFILDTTSSLVEADDKSMYRALRRYYDVGMVDYYMEPNSGGPDRKVYQLTQTGKRVLQTFVSRNILGLLMDPRVTALLK